MSSFKHILDERERELYGRQALLVEIGHRGQRKLCDARLVPEGDARGPAGQIALDYLVRAGCELARSEGSAGGVGAALDLQLPSSSEVARVAGNAGMMEAAAALLGAFTAVETIKGLTGAGSPSRFPQDFVLTSEESV